MIRKVMEMFFGSKKDKKKKEVPKLPKKKDTIIGKKVKFNGEITGEDSVFISGNLEGKITISEDLSIKKTGVVNAEIESLNLNVAGRIIGNSTVKDKTQLLETANIKGNITTPRLVVQDGAIFNGKCIMERKKKTTTTTSTQKQNKRS